MKILFCKYNFFEVHYFIRDIKGKKLNQLLSRFKKALEIDLIGLSHLFSKALLRHLLIDLQNQNRLPFDGQQFIQ